MGELPPLGNGVSEAGQNGSWRQLPPPQDWALDPMVLQEETSVWERKDPLTGDPPPNTPLRAGRLLSALGPLSGAAQGTVRSAGGLNPGLAARKGGVALLPGRQRPLTSCQEAQVTLGLCVGWVSRLGSLQAGPAPGLSRSWGRGDAGEFVPRPLVTTARPGSKAPTPPLPPRPGVRLTLSKWFFSCTVLAMCLQASTQVWISGAARRRLLQKSWGQPSSKPPAGNEP